MRETRGKTLAFLNEDCYHGKGSALVDIVGPTGLNPTTRSLSVVDPQQRRASFYVVALRDVAERR